MAVKDKKGKRVCVTHQPYKEEIEFIRNRDKTCVYCHKSFDLEHNQNNRKDWDTIEHLNHRQDWDSVGSYHKKNKSVLEIVAICCLACNSSRRDKPLLEWFKSKYCLKSINYQNVAEVVKNYIDKYEKIKRTFA